MPTALRTLAFGPLDISYDDRVLEPRPWTAAQSRWAAEVAAELPAGPVLELCSGAGHIGLLAAHLSGRHLTCVDISPAACELTRLNAQAAGLADRVEVREGPMTDVLADGEEFALVIADPPWVTSDKVTTFPEDPVLAIDGGTDGLDLARMCLEVGARHLRRDGFLVLQVGDEQQARTLASETARLRLVDVRHEERGVLALWIPVG
jgi:release factor glutamine methyltransferase